jgi:hypothetical protein
MTGPCYVVATGSPAAELVLLQVVGGVNEENAGRELGVGCIQRCRGARLPGTDNIRGP